MSENTSQAPQAQRGQPKSRIGLVLSNKMTKTVVVQVERRMKHGKYGKYLTEKKKYKCHDEQQSATPKDVPTQQPVPMNVNGKTYQVTKVFPIHSSVEEATAAAG